MAQVASASRGDPHFHQHCEQCNRIALEVDDDVHKRIRSLFNSRNDHRPPTAPCPTPDLLDHGKLANTAGRPAGERSLSGLRRLTMPEWKRHTRISTSDMIAPYLDGADKLSTPTQRRLPRRASRSEDSSMRISANEPETSMQSTQEKSNPYDLGHLIRVVPPKRTPTAQLEVRPEALRMPGSYISITSKTDKTAPDATKIVHHENHTGHEHERLDLHDSVGHSTESGIRASDSLKQLKLAGGKADPPQVAHDTETQQSLISPNPNAAHQEIADKEDEAISPLEPKQNFHGNRQQQQHPDIRVPKPPHLETMAKDMAAKENRVKSPLPVSEVASVLSSLSNQSPVRSTSRASMSTSHKRSSSMSLKLVSVSPIDSSSSNSAAGSETQEYARIDSTKDSLERGKAATAPLSTTLTRKPTHKGEQNESQDLSRSRTGPFRRSHVRSYRISEPADFDEQYYLKENGRGRAFTRAITDLESLLEEALDLADRSDGHSAVNRKPAQREERRMLGRKDTAVDTDVEQGAESSHSSIADEVPVWKPQSRVQSQMRRPGRATRHRVSSSVEEWPSQRSQGATKGSASDTVELEPLPFKAKDWAYVSENMPSDTSPPSPPPKKQKLLENRREARDKQQQAHQELSAADAVQTGKQRNRERKKSHARKLDSATDTNGSGTNRTLGNQRRPLEQDIEMSTILKSGTRRRTDTVTSLYDKETLGHSAPPEKNTAKAKDVDLSRRHHFSIRGHGFSLGRSHRHKPIARDWSTFRKRFVATVICLTTALLGMVLGIYAGEVPAIQYTLADEHHSTILGNVVLFLGLAVSTILFWPLPILHGRKPYIMMALVILLPLQFPQALAVNGLRSPSVATYRTGLLLPRALSGFVMGFANINFLTTLLDLFGASLQSRNPHQEVVNEHDVRRHGGGIGVWLGIWTWCSVMSIGMGFLIGAGIVSGLDVSWGFWVTIVINAGVLLLNVVMPEVRRSPYRRSMAEVRTGTEVSRRVARGEIKMHIDQTGPLAWYEEVLAGYRLCFMMIKQPGFLVLALYQGWIYGQIVLLIALLGALLSKYYLFRPQYVGLGVMSIPLGGLLAVPFQKASFFSRSRKTKQRTDSMTFEKRVTWSSHLVRRAIFTITLPFAGLAYTLASDGSVHYMAPILFAAVIGFLSNLALAECNGLIMETFDTSDLQPGMTGRARKNVPDHVKKKRTNFSCFPRVTAGFAVTQTFAFLIAAGTTAWAGVIERHLGAQVATAVMAGILLILTLALLGVLWRHTTVQIIPSERFGTNVLSGPEDEWKPVIIGNPSGTTRRMSLLELGKMSRWTEIRRRNRLGTWQV